MHEYLEHIDFETKEGLEQIPKYYQDKIKAFLKQPFFQNLKNPIYHKEYEFIEIEKTESHGIIDLMIECDDIIYIIDYKLKNINKPNYINQVNGYIKYLKQKTNKQIKGYLYSILEETYLEVEQ